MFVVSMLLIGVLLLLLGFCLLGLARSVFGLAAIVKNPKLGQDLSVQSLALFKPIQRVAHDIFAIHKKGPLAQQSTAEVHRILTQVYSALAIRDDLVRSRQDAVKAEKEVERLNAEIATGTDPSIITSLERALAARQEELGHYAKAQTAINKIEAEVSQALAVLSELKARLTIHYQDSGDRLSNPALAETLNQTQTFSVSIAEAQEILNSTNS